jgi:hypothetical protein
MALQLLFECFEDGNTGAVLERPCLLLPVCENPPLIYFVRRLLSSRLAQITDRLTFARRRSSVTTTTVSSRDRRPWQQTATANKKVIRYHPQEQRVRQNSSHRVLLQYAQE